MAYRTLADTGRRGHILLDIGLAAVGTEPYIVVYRTYTLLEILRAAEIVVVMHLVDLPHAGPTSRTMMGPVAQIFKSEKQRKGRNDG